MIRPTLAEAFRRAIMKGRGLSPDGQAVTMERVIRVFTNGYVEVGGRVPAVVPVTGEGLRTIRAGQLVAVGWRRNRPVVAIAHSAKRSGAPPPLPVRPAGIVETLFIARDPATGLQDVFFRNHDQVVSLGLRPLLLGDPETVRWGVTREAFYVRTAGHVYSVFTVERDRDKALRPGESLTAKLLRVDRPLQRETVLLDATFTESFTRSAVLVWGAPDNPFLGFTFIRTPLPATSGLATHRRVWRLTQELIEEGLQDDVNFTEFLFGFIDDVVLDRRHELILTVRLLIEFLTLELVGDDTGEQTALAVTCGAGPNGNTGLLVVGPTTLPMQAGHSIFNEEHAYILNGTTGELLYSTNGVVTTLARVFAQQDAVHGPFVVGGDEAPQFFAAPPAPGSASGECNLMIQFPNPTAPLFGTIPFGHEFGLVLADKQDFFDLARAPFIDEAFYDASGGTVVRAPDWVILLSSTIDGRFRFEATGDVTTSAISQRVVYRVRRLKVLLLGATLAESRFWLVVSRMTESFVTEQYRVLVIDGTGALVRVLQDWRRLSFTVNGTQFFDGILEWLGSTRRHALWYQKTGDAAATNAPREEIVIVDWTTGAARVVGQDLTTFRAHDLQALAPDFLYEGREDDDAKKFILAWDPESGALDPAFTLADALPEDDELSELKALEDLPDDVVPDAVVIDPGPFGAFPSRVEKAAWQAVNDAELLGTRAIDEPELEEPPP